MLYNEDTFQKNFQLTQKEANNPTINEFTHYNVNKRLSSVMNDHRIATSMFPFKAQIQAWLLMEDQQSYMRTSLPSPRNRCCPEKKQNPIPLGTIDVANHFYS